MTTNTPSSVPLPVLESPARMKRTRIGPWRAGVLVAVHVVMVIHVVQWLVMGTTLAPIEPSESMQTLENGLLNTGAIFFGLAVIATVVFGRYVCGWLCHIVALQDFCYWLMGKAGVRPKPFRSRLLVFVPLVLGVYMFIWPSFKRFVLQPLAESGGIDWPWWLRRVEPIYGVRDELFVEDFWATFPEWYVAVPFLLICGFATVYFLGAKAFCTYACPYGGIFGLVEPVAPVRVRVDHDKCRGCAHCTAACTSNVRVHEEIKAHGMVVDPGCMKTMDCISVCPNDALSIAPGRPALGAGVRAEAGDARETARARRASRYDLTWPGEIAAAIVFFVLFVATRGMLDQVPMLMAGGLAAVGTGLSVLLWRVLAGPNARIHRLTLKLKGKIRPAGAVFVLLMLAGWAVTLWGGAGNFARWRAETLHAGVGVPVDAVLRREFAPSGETEARARAAIGWYARAEGFGSGGFGWALNPSDKVSLAYLHTVLGETDRAVALLRDVVERGNPTDALVFQLLNLHGQIAREQSEISGDQAVINRATDEQIEMMRDALERHPELHGVRLRLAQLLRNTGRPDDGVWEIDDPEIAGDPALLLSKGQILAMRGDREGMNEILDKVIEAEPRAPDTLFSASQLANNLGRSGESRELVDRAVEIENDAPTLLRASRIAGSAGRLEDARALAERAATASGAGRPGVGFEIGKLLLAHGQSERGKAMMLDAAERLEHDPWQTLGVAFALTQIGTQGGHPDLAERGLGMFETLVGEHPDEPIFRHDYAGWLFNAGRRDEAIEHIVAAAELAPRSVVLADRASQLLSMMDRPDEAERWRLEAESRREAAP